MTIFSEVRTKLLANGAVNTRVAGKKIYNNKLPEGYELDCITIQLVDDIPITTHSGQGDLNRPIFQLSHFAANHREAAEMDVETRAVLEGYRGDLGSFTGVAILRVDSHDDLEPELDVAIRITEYQVWHN